MDVYDLSLVNGVEYTHLICGLAEFMLEKHIHDNEVIWFMAPHSKRKIYIQGKYIVSYCLEPQK